MNAKQFFAKVVEVRNAQKTYFRNKTQENLSIAKNLEKELDAEIRRVQSKANEPELPLLIY